MGVADLFIIITVIGLTLGMVGYFERVNFVDASSGELNWLLRWLNRTSVLFYFAIPVSGLVCLIYRWRLDGWPGWVPGHGLLLFLGLNSVFETLCGFGMTSFSNDLSFGSSSPIGIYFSATTIGAIALLPFAIRSVKGHRSSWKWLVFALTSVVIAGQLTSALMILTMTRYRFGPPEFVAQPIYVLWYLLGALFVVAWLVAVVRGCRMKEGLGWLHWWGVASAIGCTAMLWIVGYLQMLYYQYHTPTGQ
jgi:hypothetical protein